MWCDREAEERGGTPMDFYERWILPPILDLVMRRKDLTKYRRTAVAAARGRVLEIGIGSGLNFPLYGREVEFVYGIDPSPRLLSIARRRAAASGIPVGLLLGSATAIPLADNAVDTVVMTWTLCSIPKPPAALREMRRVLKPDGNLCFVEHGLSPEPGVERWQHRLTPAWRRLAGGCHLDRKMDDLIRQAGFDLTNLQEGYAPGPRAMSYMYQGCACRSRSQGIGPAY
jgi:ubiquinone/menaquinone biosynthesis C-methylase UbiE